MRRIAQFAPVLVALALAACSTTPDTTARAPQPEPGTARPQKLTLIDRLFGNGGQAAEEPPPETDTSAEVQRLRQEVERLRASAARRDTDPAGRARRPAEAQGGPLIGVVFAGNTQDAAFVSALASAASAYPLRFAAPGTIVPELDHYGCATASPRDCLPALAVQPGLRLLAVVDRTADDNAGQRLRFRLYDADLDIAYPSVHMTLPTYEAGPPDDDAWMAAADALLLHAEDRLRLAPMIVHSIDTDTGEIYLNHGRDLGLSVGSRLGVHPDGRLVRAPSGSPAAWIPAARTGVVEVVRFGEAGRAIAKLDSGERPRPSDYLIPVNNG